MEFEEVLKRVSHAVNLVVWSESYKFPLLNEAYDPMDVCLPLQPQDEILRVVDSLATVQIVSELHQAFPRLAGNATLFFDFPSIHGIATALHEGLKGLEPLSLEDVHPLPRVKDRKGVKLKELRLIPFSQLTTSEAPTWSPLHLQRDETWIRSSDGMHCILIPAADVNIGGGTTESARCNEQPTHLVRLNSFLMDIEPVSIGAFVRFLNCAMPPPNEKELLDWCLLEAKDKRKCHVPIVRRNDQWHVKDKVPANWPMILVSWWGANAYSLWAHGKDWHEYKSALQSFLPSEAQWEYAARGTDPQDFPWGAEECADLLNVCWDQEIHKDLNGNAPALHDLPLEPVNLTKGQSPFGLRGMAGNVWQWCRDSYDPDFYSSPLALATDAWNSLETAFRSERGGSWVGPSNLARSSFRRGRCPEAKGRCLGFRCCAPGEIVSQRSSA